ncbi:DUF2577 domain-containing protein [Faecalibacterium prausnitzii]|uniref:DUF2577 domain-containing protein n=1 Tax=Faecalibacterium prausnitzii TaxID=853 RepID=UPI003C2C9A70
MLPDATELVKLLKRTALDAVLAAKPSNIMFGKVTSVSPLKINVEQKMELGAAQLVLSRNVTDFKTKISMLQSDGWETVEHTHNHVIHDTFTGNGTSETHTHKHKINKEKLIITIHNSLVVGDQVILVRQAGGQKFVVLDRIGTS